MVLTGGPTALPKYFGASAAKDLILKLVDMQFGYSIINRELCVGCLNLFLDRGVISAFPREGEPSHNLMR